MEHRAIRLSETFTERFGIAIDDGVVAGVGCDLFEQGEGAGIFDGLDEHAGYEGFEVFGLPIVLERVALDGTPADLLDPGGRGFVGGFAVFEGADGFCDFGRVAGGLFFCGSVL